MKWGQGGGSKSNERYNFEKWWEKIYHLSVVTSKHLRIISILRCDDVYFFKSLSFRVLQQNIEE